MRKYLILLLIFVLIGCDYDNLNEQTKNEYINLRDTLSNKNEYSSIEEIPFDITISMDRITEEEITYRIIIDKPKQDLKNIRAILIHNYFTEDIFPSIGIFDDKVDLLVNNQTNKGIILVGYINSNLDIEKINIEFKLMLEYTDKVNKTHTIFYKTTNYSK